MKQQQQHPTNRGILPPETLNALDLLVDRLNASSGRLPNATANNINSKTSPPPPLPIRALLVGTNEGVGLSRSLGTMTTATTTTTMENTTRTDGTAATVDNSQRHNNNTISNNMNEDVLGRIETVWATLVSAVPPHIMAAATHASSTSSTTSNNEEAPSPVAHYKQPSHPLLSPLLLGNTVRTVTATYTNCTVIHVHMAPLVITIITLPTANLGAVRCVAIPMLKVILEPVRRIVVRSRWQNNGGGGGGESAQQQQQQQQHMQQQITNGKPMDADPLAGLTGGQKLAIMSMTPNQKTQFLIQHQQQMLLRQQQQQQQQLHQQQQLQALALLEQQQQMMLMQQHQQQGGEQNNNMSYQ